MKIKYKRVKELMPHCGDCGERLQGNNSALMPYTCSCGEWEMTIREPFEFSLKPKCKHPDIDSWSGHCRVCYEVV